MPLADAVNKAVETTTAATPAPAPAEGTPAPAAAPGTEGAKTETAPTLFFHKKEKPDAVDLSTLDPTKIPPEVLPFYKSMQADYTRKTTAVSEREKAITAERTAIGETRKMLEDVLVRATQGRVEAHPEQSVADPMEEIKALRENGEHALADQKLVEFVRAQQEAALAPQRREIEADKAVATFRETTLAARQNDPMVQAYHDYVATTFDNKDNPELNAIKADILSSPALMKRYVPVFMHFLALEAHSKNLESALAAKDANIDAIVAERIKAERTKAAGLPAKLVSSGAVTKEGAKARMSLKESLNAAVDTLTSQ